MFKKFKKENEIYDKQAKKNMYKILAKHAVKELQDQLG